MNDLTHIDLFSGIGGFALAARWAGIKTVQFVEIDKFCHKVLNKNFPGVPIHDDIKTFNINSYTASKRLGRGSEDSTRQQSSLSGKIISENEHDDIKTFTNAECNRFNGQTIPIQSRESQQEGSLPTGCNQRPFLLTGGFPCQPFSCAGKRKGTEDDRHLWPEMLRVIKEFKPTWIIGENVAGIRSMELVNSDSAVESNPDIQEDGENDYTTVLDGICNDLEGIGYEVQPIIIPACAVGAPHRRDRVWIVGNAAGCAERKKRGVCEGKSADTARGIESNSYAPDTEHSTPTRHGQDSGGILSITESIRPDNSNQWEEDWYTVALRTCVRTLDDGLPAGLARPKGWRVNSLKSLGNAVVPQIPYLIMKAILKVENES